MRLGQKGSPMKLTEMSNIDLLLSLSILIRKIKIISEFFLIFLQIVQEKYFIVNNNIISCLFIEGKI